MKVVALDASPRRDGNTSILLRHVTQRLEAEGIETHTLHFGGKPIHGCSACLRCRATKDRRCSQTGDMVNDCIQLMADADGILLGSPTYFTDVTAEMKALIDRAGYVAKANNDLFRRKVGAAVIAVRRAGSTHAFDTINHFFTISQMIIPGSCYWNMGIGLHKGEVETDEEGLHTMAVLAENMAWLMKKLA